MSTLSGCASVTFCCSSNANIVVSLSSASNSTDGGGAILVTWPLVPMIVAEAVAASTASAMAATAQKPRFISFPLSLGPRTHVLDGRRLTYRTIVGFSDSSSEKAAASGGAGATVRYRARRPSSFILPRPRRLSPALGRAEASCAMSELSIVSRLGRECCSERPLRTSGFRAPRLAGCRAQVPEDVRGREPHRVKGGYAPKGRGPAAQMRFEHRSFADECDIARPGPLRKGASLGLTEESVGRGPRRTPEPAHSPALRQLVDVSSFRLLHHDCYVEDVANSPERQVNPRMRREDEGVMLGRQREDALDVERGRHGSREELLRSGRAEPAGPVGPTVKLDLQRQIRPAQRPTVVLVGERISVLLSVPGAPKAGRQPPHNRSR